MKRTVAALAALPLIAGSLLATAAPAQADDRVCRGTIGKVTVDDNVVVPKGATCVLKGTRVEGNVEVRKGGKVIRTVVDGDIQLFSNKGRFVVRGNVVDGNLQCKSNRPEPRGKNNRVEGNKEDQCRSL